MATLLSTFWGLQVYFEDGKCAECGKKLGPKPHLEWFNNEKYPGPYFCTYECSEAVKLIAKEKLIATQPDESFDSFDIDGEVFSKYSERGRKTLDRHRSEHAAAEKKRIEEEKQKHELNRIQFVKDWNVKKEYYEDDRRKRESEESYERIVGEVRAEREHLKEHGHDILTHEPDEKNLRPVIEWRQRLAKYKPPQVGIEIAKTRLTDLMPDPMEEVLWAYEHYADKKIRSRARTRCGISLSEPVSLQDEVRGLQKLKLSPDKCMKLLFGDDEIAQCFFQEYPVCVPEDIWYQHCFILAPSGTGKTTLIEDLILRHLKKDNPPALVVIDPKGEMIKRLKALDLFLPVEGRGPLYERLVVLDATSQRPPALNPFAAAPANLPAEIRERIENQAIANLEYIFSSSDFALTSKQSVGFAFLARLLFKIPGANLDTLLDVVEEYVPKGEASKYQPYIDQLDGTAQRFFRRDFWDEFKETKSQIKGRVYRILSSPAAQRTLNASRCTVDWYSALQRRDIILVNTGFNQDRIGSQVLGRYVIASVYAAARARELLPRTQWNPAFMFVDEAQLFVDERQFPQEILSFVREYNLGVTLSTQQMTGIDFNDNIRSSISTNTSMKFAASVEGDDLRFAARDLRATPEFIQEHALSDAMVNFACYVRNTAHKKPFTVSVRKGRIKEEPIMPPGYVEFCDNVMADIYADKAIPKPTVIKEAPKSNQPTKAPPTTKASPNTPENPSDDPDYF